ncbi:MAG TPA: hypothetical protein VFQ59_03190, partial [Candidatus Paceibacterota bacterium]|nr:hypothetical protein [Candidatus Paceibacterota bacterium]
MSLNFEKPNYVNSKSEEAEGEFEKFIDSFYFLGLKNINPGEVFSTKEAFQVISSVSPKRLDLVASKLNIPVGKLSELTPNSFSDKVLGVDKYFKFNKKIFGVDVATGKASSLI